jgi:hypothetical protein
MPLVGDRDFAPTKGIGRNPVSSPLMLTVAMRGTWTIPIVSHDVGGGWLCCPGLGSRQKSPTLSHALSVGAARSGASGALTSGRASSTTPESIAPPSVGATVSLVLPPQATIAATAKRKPMHRMRRVTQSTRRRDATKISEESMHAGTREL